MYALMACISHCFGQVKSCSSILSSDMACTIAKSSVQFADILCSSPYRPSIASLLLKFAAGLSYSAFLRALPSTSQHHYGCCVALVSSYRLSMLLSRETCADQPSVLLQVVVGEGRCSLVVVRTTQRLLCLSRSCRRMLLQPSRRP